MNKYTKDSLISRFYEIHQGLYEYPDFEYISTYGRINIVCDSHGVFNQQIRKHLEGQGCKKCASLSNSRKWKHLTGYRDSCGKQVQYQDYTVWRAMIQRTKPSYWEKHPHYTGTTVSDMFKSWDSYKDWVDSKFNSKMIDVEGNVFELDKDLLSDGSRKYSEDTCCFIPRLINVGLRNKSENLLDLVEFYKESIEPNVYKLLVTKATEFKNSKILVDEVV